MTRILLNLLTGQQLHTPSLVVGDGTWDLEENGSFPREFHPETRHLSGRGAGGQTSILPAGWAGSWHRLPAQPTGVAQ